MGGAGRISSAVKKYVQAKLSLHSAILAFNLINVESVYPASQHQDRWEDFDSQTKALPICSHCFHLIDVIV
jgi:hypothetical protein